MSDFRRDSFLAFCALEALFADFGILTACHPSLVAIPGDFDPVTKPLSLAVGTKDSLLDMDSVGKIQDLIAKKTDVPHELQV